MPALAIDNQIFLSQLHSYGLGIRYSRDLMAIQSAENALELSARFLESLGLCGYLRFTAGDCVTAERFGDAIPRKLLRDLHTLRNTVCRSEKMCTAKECMIIKSSTTFILIVRHSETNPDIDSLQDILAVMIDTLDAWLSHYLMRTELSRTLQDSLIELIDGSRELVESHQAATDDLLAEMVMKFPTLGLEPDQEEMVLDIIKATLDEHVRVIEGQIHKNNSIGDVLISSVDLLTNSDAYRQDDSPGDSENCVELF